MIPKKKILIDFIQRKKTNEHNSKFIFYGAIMDSYSNSTFYISYSLENIREERSKSFGQNSEGKNTQMEMIVSGKSKSLAVRDKANIKKGKVLQKLKKGDKVIWNGNLVFAKVKDEHIEAWVQIETKKGVKGWTRLFYLYPQNYKEQQFFVVERE